MESIAIWLAGNLVAPDAYQRVLSRLSKRTTRQKLLREARRAVKGFPRRTLRVWYRNPVTREALTKGGPQSLVVLERSLHAVAQAHGFSSWITAERSAMAVQAIAEAFVRSLEPSEAVAVHEKRSESRHAEQLRTTEIGLRRVEDTVVAGLQDLASAVITPDAFDQLVESLPGPAREALRSAGPSPDTRRLLDVVRNEPRRTALIQLTAELPGWLQEASLGVQLAAAELCRSYWIHTGAGRLLELASDHSGDRAYLLARAAIEFESVDDHERGRALIEKALSLSRDERVRAIDAAIRGLGAEILATLTEDEALSDSYLPTVYAFALQSRDDANESISFLEKAIARYPLFPGMRIELAKAYLRRSMSAAANRSGDREAAILHATSARDLRRSWNADAGDAVAVICHAALMLSAYEMVLTNGLMPPDGTALPGEAGHADVKVSVAQAAMVLGRQNLILPGLEGGSDDFDAAIIRAEILAQSADDLDGTQRAFDQAWTMAESGEQRAYYWLSASQAGVDLLGVEQLALRDDEVPTLVEAQVLMSRGTIEDAIALLRGLPPSEGVSRLMVTGLLKAGDVDGAVDVLKSAANRYNEPAHLVRAVEVLYDSKRLDEAADLARLGLERLARSLRRARRFLHQVLLEEASSAGRWGDTIARCHAWITDLGASSEARWHLAYALFMGGDRKAAWRTIQDNPRLDVDSVHQAKLWIVVASQEEPSPRVADAIIGLIDHFPDDDLKDAAAALFFGRGDGTWGQVKQETITRFQALLETRAVDFGSTEDAVLYKISGSPEQMLEQMRPMLEARARVGHQLAMDVRRGAPYGLLAATAGRPLSLTILQRAAGVLTIAHPGAEALEIEVGAARTAIGSRAIIDVSTLCVGAFVQETWRLLASHFRTLELPRPGLADLNHCLDFLSRPADGSIYFDLAADSMRGTDTDPAVEVWLKNLAEWARERASECALLDWHEFVSLKQGMDPAAFAWLAAVDVAKTNGTPLWCDDFGVRALALSEGVQTFGTVALLRALVETDRLSPSTETTALRQLREAYAVDLPLDREWMLVSAASNGWRPGPVTATFSRPLTWIDPHATFLLWCELVRSAAQVDREVVIDWVEAAALGAIAQLPEPQALATLTSLAGMAVAATGFDGPMFAQCAAAIRCAAASSGLANPVPRFATEMMGYLTTAMGPQLAARHLLCEQLEAIDRDVVRDVVFGTEGSSPFVRGNGENTALRPPD